MTLIHAGMAHRVSAASWADILHELNVCNYDLHLLEYLQAIVREKQQPNRMGVQGKTYTPFSSFEDKNAYAGFYPSCWYINSIYMDYMEHIQPVLDQCMATLTGTVIKWDHSFKLSKLLTKMDGVAIFIALFTLVNEKEQIRYQAFTPTKSLSHLHVGLEKFSESLTLHGHPPTKLGYTDNVASDTGTFIKYIPALGKDVEIVDTDEHPELDTMVLPPDVTVVVCKTEAEIQSVCDAILERMLEEPAVLHVGFDMEWDFNAERSGGSNATALIQIALSNIVYLLRICFLKKLPEALKIIITNTRVVKIGCSVGGDLAKLARDFSDLTLSLQPKRRFDGVMELEALAKAKNVVSRETASLSAITAAALHLHLLKEM